MNIHRNQIYDSFFNWLLLRWLKCFAVFWYKLVCGTIYHLTKAVQVIVGIHVVGSVMVVGVLTCCTLFYSVSDLKAVQMNMQYSLIWELMPQLDQNTTEATKNIWVKDEGRIDHSTVNRWLKKIHRSGCKNLNDQARLGRPKAIDSKAIATNQVSSTQRISGEFGISQFSVVCHFHNLSKIICSYWLVPHVYHNIAKLLTHSGIFDNENPFQKLFWDRGSTV